MLSAPCCHFHPFTELIRPRYFSTAVSSSKNRKTFANKILSVYKQFHLDGIDIDWEYPGQSGYHGNHVSRNDTANLLLFLQQLRTTLPASAKISATGQTVPFADSNGNPIADASPFAAVLDWVLIMNYDTWGGTSACRILRGVTEFDVSFDTFGSFKASRTQRAFEQCVWQFHHAQEQRIRWCCCVDCGRLPSVSARAWGAFLRIHLCIICEQSQTAVTANPDRGRHVSALAPTRFPCLPTNSELRVLRRRPL